MDYQGQLEIANDRAIETSIEVYATVGTQTLQASSFDIKLELYDCLSWFDMPTIESQKEQMGSAYIMIIAQLITNEEPPEYCPKPVYSATGLTSGVSMDDEGLIKVETAETIDTTIQVTV